MAGEEVLYEVVVYGRVSQVLKGPTSRGAALNWALEQAGPDSDRSSADWSVSDTPFENGETWVGWSEAVTQGSAQGYVGHIQFIVRPVVKKAPPIRTHIGY